MLKPNILPRNGNQFSALGSENHKGDTLHLVLIKTREFLSQKQSRVGEDELHKIKSLLYAAVEQLGTKAEHLFSLQRMLRELFSIVNSACDLREYEKKVGFQILDELEQRHPR